MSEEAFVTGTPGGAPGRNASDPVEVRTLDALLRDKAAEQLLDLKTVLAIPEGRRVLWRLLELTEVYGSTFSQSHATASLLEGKRGVGIALITWISSVDPKEYPRLMVEGACDRATDELIRQARVAEQKSRNGER